MSGSALLPPPSQEGPAWAGGASGRSARWARWGLLGAWGLAALVHAGLAPEGRAQHWPLGYLLLELLAASSLGYRALRMGRAERLPWGLLALSATLEVANLALMALGIQGILGGWVQDASLILTMVTGVLVLAGILSFPRGGESLGALLRRALDGLIFAASLLFLLWVMGAQTSVRVAGDGTIPRFFAAYLNAALIGGGLVFMTSYDPDRIRGPLGWLALSASAWLVGVSWWTFAGFGATYLEAAWLFVVGGIPVFQGLAAWSPRPVDLHDPARRPESRLARLFPYMPVVGALAVLALLLPQTPLGMMRGAFGIFLVMVVLLLLRQFQAIQDLQVARRTLEERVQARTTALEQAQDTLLRTERLNTLALMGAGLTHDLNNLLCAMKSSAELAVLKLDAGHPPEAHDLARIATAADRAAQLTQRLMGFIRREPEQLAPTDLGLEVKEVEPTLRLILPRSVILRIEVEPGGPLVVMNSRLRLEQMLVNLVANARDAMPGGGVLTIRLGTTAGDAGRVLLQVADTGTGMPPEVLERVFDPFFTTKAPGKGTGLGLSSLKVMVEECGGQLAAESEAGRGSRFTILLPRLPVG